MKMAVKKKKILILSMLGGFGHIRAGEAMLDYAKENLRSVSAEHFDISDISPSLKKYSKFYEFLSKRFPFIWEIIYKYVPPLILRRIVGAMGPFHNKIRNYINEKNPDFIIFTNLIIAPMFSRLLNNPQNGSIVAAIITDYHGHPYFNFPFVDYYFVGHQNVKKDLEEIGVNPQKIMVTGIPINPRFYIPQNTRNLKLKHGIKNNFPIVLFIASFKISKSKLLKTVKQILELEPQVNLIFIGSGNRKFYEIIKNSFEGCERFLTVNWTNLMEEYIKISDVVISKPGGLTASECMALKKPIIMVNPIPGQEERNAEFLEKNNLGVRAKKIGDITKILKHFIEKPKLTENDFIPAENPCKKIFDTLLYKKISN